MKIHPSAKRHANQIMKLIEMFLDKNYQDFEGSYLHLDDYEEIRKKLENKFNRLIEKKEKSKLPLNPPMGPDWFTEDGH